MKRSFVILFILVFLSYSLWPVYGYGYVHLQEFLCEIGIKLYQQGRYDEALHEFKKALLVQPNYKPALMYIQMIEQGEVVVTEPIVVPSKDFVLPAFEPAGKDISEIIKETLDLVELQKMMISQNKAQLEGISLKGAYITKKEAVSPPMVLTLDGTLSSIPQPIEIEKGKSIIVLGRNINRFLVTQPGILTIEREDTDRLILTGNDIGYTYVHFWDDNGRWTVEFLGVPPRPEGPTLEELIRQEEERAATFKLRYILDWRSFEEGRRLGSLKRGFYSWHHNLTLNGNTPYGDVDSTAIIRRLSTTADLTYFTLGLREGVFWNFKDFAIRGFDFSPGFSNLAFPGSVSTLRGIMLYSPVSNKKIDYTVFWGREGSGRYGDLSPGLAKTKRSYLNGFNVNFYPTDDMGYSFSVAHGYGRDRRAHLNNYAYDFAANFKLDKWNVGYEIGFDSETFAHLLNGSYKQPELHFTYELRDISKNYLTIDGETFRRGEQGGLFTLTYTPNELWRIYNNLNVYRDRLFPATDNDDRWSQDYDLNVDYVLSPTSTLRFDYTLQNELGESFQRRYMSPGLGLSKTFHILERSINSYINLRHQDSKNYSSHALDYINDGISMGIRVNLIGELYYYLSHQWNWLEERFTASRSKPQALETGLDLNSQIFNSPFYETLRFTYRDEEDTGSTLSFLAGQDYIEGYAELTYRPVPGKETYCSTRIRNVWAENPNVTKRIEADFNVGMRYLWDTGFRWEAVGSISGQVFKDLNADGLRQRDEPPVEGVKVWLGKNRSTTTDIFGYYEFTKVKGRKVFVSIDIPTLPPGFVLTVPYMQEASTVHGHMTRIDFGIASRSEISGIVFCNVDGNDQYSRGDFGVKGAVLNLEDGTKVTTEADGRYTFRKASAGEHIITLNLESLPVNFLPKVALVKEIVLSEGVTYVYNIPLKEIKK